MNLVGRILQHVVHADTGCWIYSGGVGGDGYATTKISGKSVRTHRFMESMDYCQKGWT